MQNKISQIESLPISAQLLSRYLDGTASEVEKTQIDALLQEDEMLRESMEGLKLMKNPTGLILLAEELNSLIGVKSGFLLPKNTLFHLSKVAMKPMMAIAASLIVVAGSFFLIQKFSNSEKQIAVLSKKDTANNTTAQEFEKSTLYSDSEVALKVEDKKSETNEEAILNQGYIDLLDSTKKGGGKPSPSLNYGATTAIVSTGNMMNPMKTMIPGGLLSDKGESNSEELNDGINKSKKNAEQLLKGQIIDNQTNQPIKGASIIVDGRLVGTSNVNGFYDVPLEGGKHNLAYKLSGYDDETQQVEVSGEAQKPVNIGLNRSVVASNGLEAKFENQMDKDSDQSIKSASTVTSKASNAQTLSKETSDLKTGLTNYSTQNYAGAITSLTKTLAKDPNNKEALFYLAMSHYNLGNSNKAISYYSKTIANGGKYKEDALWYKAQILLKQKNNEAARVLLEELKDTKYSQRALKLMESIKK